MSTVVSRNLMTEGDYRRVIIRFAIPVFIGNLFQQFYNTADSLIVGNLLGPNALAAVTSTGSLIYLLIGFFMGFSTGAGIIIARRIGAGDRELTSRAVHTDAAMGLIFSLIMTGVGVLCSPLFLKWMGTPAEVMSDAALYLRIYFGGSSALIMYNTFVGILQASGDSRHPLYYLICSSLINIVLDVLFIAVFHMGVDGAALATVISEVISALLVMRRLMITDESTHLYLNRIRVHMEDLREIVRYGLPTAVQACMIDIGNIAVQSYINSFGRLAMAGIGAYQRVEGFSFLPVNAFSMALSTFVSQNLGAGKKDRMRQGIRFGILGCIIMIEAVGVLLYLFAPVMIRAFNQNPDVIAFGSGRAHVCSLFFFLLGFSHVTSAVMRGVGRPKAPMFVMLICWCAVRVTVLFTVGRVFHNIYLTHWLYPLTWFLSSAVYLIYMKRLRSEGVL